MIHMLLSTRELEIIIICIVWAELRVFTIYGNPLGNFLSLFREPSRSIFFKRGNRLGLDIFWRELTRKYRMIMIPLGAIQKTKKKTKTNFCLHKTGNVIQLSPDGVMGIISSSPLPFKRSIKNAKSEWSRSCIIVTRSIFSIAFAS